MIDSSWLRAFATLPAARRAPLALNDRTFPRWRDYIRRRHKERAFEQVLWRTTFWGAVLEGQQKDVPVLVWAMNGHPLGCT